MLLPLVPMYSPYRPTLRQVDANNSLALPELQGKRLDQTTAWIVEVYTTELVLGVHSQQSGRVNITAKIGVSATPVADRSVWGRMPLVGSSGAMQARGCGHIESIAEVITLAVGDSEDIPFQTCD
eukprot:scaffold24139_cov51-Phaeocystis_antarctica.AAC.2